MAYEIDETANWLMGEQVKNIRCFSKVDPARMGRFMLFNIIKFFLARWERSIYSNLSLS